MPAAFLGFLTHAATAAVAAVIAWLTTSYWESQKLANERDKAKIEIVNLTRGKDQDLTLATALIDYYKAKYASSDEAYRVLLISISRVIASLPPRTLEQVTPPVARQDPDVQRLSKTEIADASSSSIQDQLFSANRRKYSDHLVDLYGDADETAKRDLVSKLLAAIIPQNSDEERRYRINIYVARTFALLPKAEDKDKAVYTALNKLTSSPEYKQDPTFKQNVDAAVARQGRS